MRRLGLGIFFFSVLIHGIPSFATVSVQEEIAETRSKIEKLQSDPKSSESRKSIKTLNSYLEVLQHALNKSAQEELRECEDSDSDSDSQIEDDVKEQVLAILSKIDQIFTNDVDVTSLFEMVEWIEQNKGKWRKKHEKEIEYKLKLKNGTIQKLKIKIFYDEDKNGTIYIDTDHVLGEGSIMVFKQIHRYQDMKAFAHGKLKPGLHKSKTAQHRLENGTKFLTRISKLKAEEREGLCETYHVGKKDIVEELLPIDLFDIVNNKDPQRKNAEHKDPDFDSPKQVIQVVSQLSAGLQRLHEMGIYHNDIKLENIRMEKFSQPNTDGSRYRAALIDYDLAEDEESLTTLINKKHDRPRNGTKGYWAPEIVELNKTWKGGSTDETIANILKSDVFSLATVALMAQTGRPPAYNTLPFNGFNPTYTAAYKQRVENTLLSLSTAPKYDPFTQVVIRGLAVDPAKRISAAGFNEGMQYLKTRKAIIDTTTTATKKEIGAAVNNLSRVDDPRAAKAYLLKQPAGTFALFPLETRHGGQYRIGIAFKSDEDPRHVQIKELDIAPTDNESLKEELQFLDRIGALSLKRQIVISK